MARLRFNFQSGTITGSMNSSTTTLNSAALSTFPVVTAPDYAPVTLYPEGSVTSTPPPETVYITAHSSGATSATIIRAAENYAGLGSQTYAANTTWVHGDTRDDLPDENLVWNGDFVGINQTFSNQAVGWTYNWLGTDANETYSLSTATVPFGQQSLEIVIAGTGQGTVASCPFATYTGEVIEVTGFVYGVGQLSVQQLVHVTDTSPTLTTGAQIGTASTWVPFCITAAISEPFALVTLQNLTASSTANFANIRARRKKQNEAMPVGAIVDYAGTTAPIGWLLCNGASVLRAQYSNLFHAIGTTYGSSDGTHFNVPDSQGRVKVGAGTSSVGSTWALGDGNNGNYAQFAGPTPSGNIPLEDAHVIVTAELASHTHTYAHTHTTGNHAHTAGGLAHSHGGGVVDNNSGVYDYAPHSHAMFPDTAFAISNDESNTGYVNSSWYGVPYSGGAVQTYGQGATNGAQANIADPPHGHGINSDLSAGYSTDVATTTTNSQSTTTTISTGSGNAHNNIQPYLVVQHIIKY